MTESAATAAPASSKFVAGGPQHSEEFAPVQIHDFGVVRPRQVVTHRFPICNSTQQTWTTSRIETTCSCTLTQMTAKRITPGAMEFAEVSYTAGDSTGDDRRQLRVHFQEAEAPVLVLGVQASVRDRMTVTPRELVLGLSSSSVPLKSQFEIENFDEADWSEIEVRPQAAWMTVSVSQIQKSQHASRSPNPVRPKQQWRVVVTADARKLQPGKYTDTVAISSVGTTESVRASVAVSMEVPQPIRVTPREFFLGAVPPGQTTSRVLLVLFQQNSSVHPSDHMTIQHDLGDEFEATWGEARGEYWELRGAFTAADRHEGGSVEGAVVLHDNSDRTLVLKVPVKVLVEK